MNPETKTCQNCKKDFVIDSEDFNFYEKMQVPAPTFCPQCRFQRRMMFRNERALYRRTCDLCNESMVTTFAPEKELIVYCQKCWWSDNWDDGAIYLDYDPEKNIFDQMKELRKKTPHMALVTDYSTLKNSEYNNHVGSLKDCFMLFNMDYGENCLYCNLGGNVKDCMDAFMIGESELVYDTFGCGPAYNVFFSEDVGESNNIYFSRDMRGCNNCFGCYGLRNKSYHIFNEPYSKEEYQEKVKEFEIHKYSNVEAMYKKAREFWAKFPRRYMRGDTRNINVTGDYVWEAKNAKHCFQARYVEDSAYCQFITFKSATNVYDITEWGMDLDMCVDCLTCGGGVSNMKYNAMCWSGNSFDVQYSNYVVGSQNMFACINQKRKKNRILNKEYSEEEFKTLREQIIKSMNEKPYVDSKGRKFTYGEFLPYDLSPFDYNETYAIQYYPLTKEQTLENGWRWHDEQSSPHKITMQAKDIPDSIHDIDESILQEILGCSDCGKPYKIVGPEYQKLKQWEFPIPRKCPTCRNQDRINLVNPYYLWKRKCQCAGQHDDSNTYANTAIAHQSHGAGEHCPNEFQTAYSPDSGDIVYCEACYQSEAV